jgi:hypothetical protein
MRVDASFTLHDCRPQSSMTHLLSFAGLFKFMGMMKTALLFLFKVISKEIVRSLAGNTERRKGLMATWLSLNISSPFRQKTLLLCFLFIICTQAMCVRSEKLRHKENVFIIKNNGTLEAEIKKLQTDSVNSKIFTLRFEHNPYEFDSSMYVLLYFDTELIHAKKFSLSNQLYMPKKYLNSWNRVSLQVYRKKDILNFLHFTSVNIKSDDNSLVISFDPTETETGPASKIKSTSE